MEITPGLFQIDHQSKLPLYEQIEVNLRQLILSGEIEPGEGIPPENDLATIYGVSRLTVRRALDELVRQKLLVKRQGIGTFVNRSSVTSIAPSKLSFTQQVLAVGKQPSSQLIDQHVTKATPEIADALEIPEGEPVTCISRIRLASGLPILFETVYFSLKRFPGFENVEGLDQMSIYEYLVRQYNTRVSRIEQTLHPVLLTPTEAKYLHLPSNSPSIQSESVAYTSDDVPIEYSTSVANGDNCTFYFTFHKEE
jgi:GntR family transcriptional regulator